MGADTLTGMAMTNVTEVRHGVVAGVRITLHDSFTQLLRCGYRPSLRRQLESMVAFLRAHGHGMQI